MFDTLSYIGRKVIVYDTNCKSALVETVIREFDKLTQTISIDADHFPQVNDDHVTVLIFSNTCIYEYKGTLKKAARSELINIALYRRSIKEDRTSARYTVNVPAVVDHLVIGNQLVPLRQPFEVTVINISTSGILMRGNINLLNTNTTFQLKLNIGNNNQTLLNTSVVRIKPIDSHTTEYGCKFNFQY